MVMTAAEGGGQEDGALEMSSGVWFGTGGGDGGTTD